LRALAAVGEVHELDGALAVSTGLLSNVDNGVVCTSPDLPQRAVDEAVGWLVARKVPASWIGEDVEASDALRARLVAAGCTEDTGASVAGAALADVERIEPVPPPGVVIEEVADDRGVRGWLDVADACRLFDDEPDRRGEALRTAGRHWIASRGRTAVGMATAFFDRGIALLEHVAVLPEERRRGIATALARARLSEARRLGCTWAVFATTPESIVLYEPLGFTTAPSPPGGWFYLACEP
jgi:GNAT superfamily N-acetyltransferase